MERLKAALDKARTEREGRTVGARGMRQRMRPGAAGAQDAEALWADLEPLDLDRKRCARRRIVTASGGPEAAPFDVLRTKTVQMAEANGWSRIAITSPLPASGKTTTTLNLAFSLARLVEKRVIVLDLDMRRPSIAKALGCKSGRSTRAVLEGTETFARQARRVGNNLAISMNFTGARDPSDLFLRTTTDEMIERIEAVYRPDFMLFDMPPVLVNDDTSAFLHNVDAGLIVAEAGGSTIAQIDSCEREVAAQTNVLGVVLNKCRYYSDGYAHYAYSYNYS
ncbi:MAG: CpsD/CapB family tyrosine-protein kinase [Pseudomonadota bacterium]